MRGRLKRFCRWNWIVTLLVALVAIAIEVVSIVGWFSGSAALYGAYDDLSKVFGVFGFLLAGPLLGAEATILFSIVVIIGILLYAIDWLGRWLFNHIFPKKTENKVDWEL